jgi:hypothetical protein
MAVSTRRNVTLCLHCLSCLYHNELATCKQILHAERSICRINYNVTFASMPYLYLLTYQQSLTTDTQGIFTKRMSVIVQGHPKASSSTRKADSSQATLNIYNFFRSQTFIHVCITVNKNNTELSRYMTTN